MSCVVEAVREFPVYVHDGVRIRFLLAGEGETGYIRVLAPFPFDMELKIDHVREDHMHISFVNSGQSIRGNILEYWCFICQDSIL